MLIAIQFRHELELDPNNAAALAAIDSSAFVMCLDDEAPSNASERHMQFLLNGRHNPFTNRWLDKPVQFAVAANGLSSGIYEHSKVDGMDVRGLHRHVTHAIFAHSAKDLDSTASPYPFHEHVWKPALSITQRVEHVRAQCSSYGIIDHQYVDVYNFGVNYLRQNRVPPKATAHLAVLLAMYLVDGTTRPAWEIVSLATLAHGRLDWLQTVSPPVRDFVLAAAAALSGNSPDQRNRARSLLATAAAAHSAAISAGARGKGYVNHMYALLGLASTDADADSLPAIFRTRAWDATRRGGPGQDLKIGFMPATDDPEDRGVVSWDEGGFLMEGERGVYVHCDVGEDRMRFAVSARPEYAAAVCNALRRATATISSLLV